MRIEVNLTQGNRENLAAFAKRGDRREPMFFVGREKILQDIEEQLQETNEAEGSLSNARLIQGPPGSGKTSILAKLNERYGKADTVVPVRLSGEQLRNPAAVATAFVKSCGFNEKVLGRAHQTRVSGRAGTRWIGASGNYGSLTASPLDRITQGIPVLDLLDDYISPPSETTFLVLVDETQRIASDEGQAVNSVAVALADGNTGKMKTLTVFGGLSDTGARLTSVGVSPRITQGAKHLLGAFEKSEARELLSTFIAHKPFGLDKLEIQAKEGIVDSVVEASECYPRHLHGYMQGLSQTLANTTSAYVELKDLLEFGHTSRLDYYDDLLGFANLGTCAAVISKVVTQTPSNKSFTFGDLKKAATEHYGMTSKETEQAYETAIHCGVLEVDTSHPIPERHLRMPIPSFRTYAATGFDRAQTRKWMHESLSLTP